MSSDSRAQQLHDQIRQAVRRHNAAMHTLVRLLEELDREQLYRVLGYTTLADYAWSEHELGRRKLRDLLHIGRSLDDLPALDRAMSRGEVPWTKVRTLLPVVDATNEAAWVARARGTTVRDLERQVHGLTVGSQPPAPHEARGEARHRFVVEMYSQEHDLVRDALAVLRAQAGDPDVSDGALLAQLARTALKLAESGDTPPTGEPYRIVLERCPDCERTVGVDDEVSDTLVEEASCHAEIVDLTPDATDRGRLKRTIPLRTQRLVFHEARYRCEVPGCDNRLWLNLHHLALWSRGGGHARENLVCLCASHHRAVHEGVLAMERLVGGALRFERLSGGVANPVPHVGRPGPQRAMPGTSCRNSATTPSETASSGQDGPSG